jgi:hypothetical protein
MVDLLGHEAGNGWGTGKPLTESAPALCAVASALSQMRASLRSIQRSPARQTDHASTSSTASNARK